MPGLCFVDQESFKQRHYFSLHLLSGNFKGRRVVCVLVFPFLILDISKIPATCNETFNHLIVSIVRCPSQWGAASLISLRHIDTKILEQHSNNSHTIVTTQQKGSGVIRISDIDIDVCVC